MLDVARLRAALAAAGMELNPARRRAFAPEPVAGNRYQSAAAGTIRALVSRSQSGSILITARS